MKITVDETKVIENYPYLEVETGQTQDGGQSINTKS